ncbi:MAG: RNA polymerase sigma factor [Desulfobacteraceae bacterium]|nr:MAG: RNA polymerase sigma factor [Desulfobacteraceae bacterium]
MKTFKDFYNRHRRKFLTYLVRRSGDYQLSCDIMQESFIRIYEKYTAENYAPQLLYTIGRNLVLDSFRRLKHAPATLEDNDQPVDSQEHDFMVRDEYRRVLDAMQKLDDDERDLLTLVVSSEMSYREVAQIAGISEVNVKVKIHRARKKLREYLKAGEK